jgi:hypothetical protein
MKSLQSRELRIGNLVQTEYEGVIEVVNINGEGFDYVDFRKPGFRAIGRYEIEPNVKPIPLTEEWLSKLDFKGRRDFKWNDKVGIQIKDGKFYFAFKDLGNVIFHSIVEVKSVHHLQNVYYSLTNKELTIN